MNWKPWKSIVKGLKAGLVCAIGVFLPEAVEALQANPKTALYAPLVIAGLSAAKNAAKHKWGFNLPF